MSREEKKWKREKRTINSFSHFTFHISLILIIFCQLFSIPQAFAWQKSTANNPKKQHKYEQKLLREEEIEKYKRSLLLESGYMTTDDYERLSKDVPNAKKNVPPPPAPKDIKMKYIPQPIYKLTHYNDPPGSPELHILRRFKFDRQMNCTGITSPNKDIMVYPTVYYYAINQCTAGDLFVIPLDKTLSDIDRVQRANVIKKIPEPILSTEKNIQEKFTFRTMTPIDFSPDGSKLIAKEKIGNVNDGIWKTNLWVYDFNTQKARELHEIREAIKFYWLNNANLFLEDKRWDIYPLGFDANDPERVVVSAYGYTGNQPVFLGNWSIDCNGERTLLVSLFEPKAQISINGFKLVQDGVLNPKKALASEKSQNKAIKKKRAEEKKAKKKIKSEKKKALNKRLREIKSEKNSSEWTYEKRQGSKGLTEED